MSDPSNSLTIGSTSTSLLERAKARDPEAWRRLVRIYGPHVFFWCRQSGLSVQDAADVVQEVFTAVATHLAKFHRRGPGDSFRGWLRTITQNKIRDQARRGQHRPQAQGGTTAQKRLEDIPAPASDSGEPAELIGSSAIMHQALELIRDEFEDRTWQAFWQMAIEGRSASELGAELGMERRAVRQAKYRVLRRLRQELVGLIE